jgi:hypothetical protein
MPYTKKFFSGIKHASLFFLNLQWRQEKFYKIWAKGGNFKILNF